MKSSGMAPSATNACLKLHLGSRKTISSPRREISTSSTRNRNCLGRRTARLLPDLNPPALLTGVLPTKVYTEHIYVQEREQARTRGPTIPQNAPLVSNGGRRCDSTLPSDFLTRSQRHTDELARNPSQWMPWS